VGWCVELEPGRFARARVLGVFEGSREKAARAVRRLKAFVLVRLKPHPDERRSLFWFSSRLFVASGA
jgi:hypothetical protein